METIHWRRPNFPLEVSVLVTDLCNFNCKHCFVRGRNINKLLSFSQIKSIIDEMAKHHIFNLNISGGEPFVHPEIFRILKYAESRGMEIHLNTNLTLLDKQKINRLARIKIAHIDVSIHAFTDEGLRDFCKATSFSSKLKENIIYGFQKHLPLAFTSTLTRLNYKETFNFFNFLKEKKFSTFFLAGLFHPSGRGLENFRGLLLSEKELDRIYKKLIELSNKTGISLIIQKRCNEGEFSKNLQEILKSPTTGNFGCPCGEYSCFVWPDGNVTFCPYGYDKIFFMGNINRHSLAYIWNSNTLQWKRRRANAINTKCKYFDKCLGGCPSDAFNLKGRVNICDPLCVFNRNHT